MWDPGMEMAVVAVVAVAFIWDLVPWIVVSAPVLRIIFPMLICVLIASSWRDVSEAVLGEHLISFCLSYLLKDLLSKVVMFWDSRGYNLVYEFGGLGGE